MLENPWRRWAFAGWRWIKMDWIMEEKRMARLLTRRAHCWIWTGVAGFALEPSVAGFGQALLDLD